MQNPPARTGSLAALTALIGLVVITLAILHPGVVGAEDEPMPAKPTAETDTGRHLLEIDFRFVRDIGHGPRFTIEDIYTTIDYPRVENQAPGVTQSLRHFRVPSEIRRRGSLDLSQFAIPREVAAYDGYTGPGPHSKKPVEDSFILDRWTRERYGNVLYDTTSGSGLWYGSPNPLVPGSVSCQGR